MSAIGREVATKRRVRFVLPLVIFLALCLSLPAGGCIGGGDDLKISGPGVEDATDSSLPPGVTPPVQIEGKPGQPETLGDITWVYESSRKMKVLEAQGAQEKTPGAFVVVSLKAETSTPEAVIDQGQFRIRDSENRTFFASAKSWILGSGSLLPYPKPGTPVPPGQRIARELTPTADAQGSVIFEVPSDAAELTLTIVDQRGVSTGDPRAVRRLSGDKINYRINPR